MTMPTISVLLPVYNGEPFLRAAIESILTQTVRDIEVLIVDDGSTDESLQTIKALARDDDRIRFRSRSNLGLVATLNELIQWAESPFIARMDADDIALPERFERQLDRFARDPELLALGSDTWCIDSKGRRLMVVRMPHSHHEIDECAMQVATGTGMCHPSMMFRSTAFKLAGPYSDEFWPAEDADLILRIVEKGRVANLDEALLLYRVHGNSISHRQAARQRDAHFRAAAAAAARRGTAPPDPRSRELPAHQRDDIESLAARDTKWAWWALKAGNLRVARSLATRAVLRKPFAKDTWRVLACAIRGR